MDKLYNMQPRCYNYLMTYDTCRVKTPKKWKPQNLEIHKRSVTLL